MAIKVIDEPLDSRVVKRTHCMNCGVTLEYTPADTRTVTKKDYGGGSDTYRLIDCPRCGEPVTVGFA